MSEAQTTFINSNGQFNSKNQGGGWRNGQEKEGGEEEGETCRRKTRGKFVLQWLTARAVLN
ncbi:MAG: hypothetical protein ACP5PX_00045 [Candidatus Hadarchaeum sp.]|uniref:hypothetical protein n=1 Tax=Candidatus Hadarchaeum sp. TaxID=2883567 RepID=UPI003D10859A